MLECRQAQMFFRAINFSKFSEIIMKSPAGISYVGAYAHCVDESEEPYGPRQVYVGSLELAENGTKLYVLWKVPQI